MVVIGASLLAVGCYWHYPPLAPIVSGVLLCAAGVVSHILSRRGDVQ